MVKFGKKLEEQLVQEWRSAYINYKELKRAIASLKQEPSPVPDKWENAPITPSTPKVSGPSSGSASPKPHYQMNRNLTRQLTNGVNRIQKTVTGTYDSFKQASGQAAEILRSGHISKRFRRNPDVIKVKKTEPAALGQYEVYTTEVMGTLGSLEVPTRNFFLRLDAEFNKVNQFYTKKEREFIQHYETLKKQVAALEEIRTILKQGPQLQHQDENNLETDTVPPQTIAEAVEIATKRHSSRQASFFSKALDGGREGSGQEFGAVLVEDCDSSRGGASTRSQLRKAGLMVPGAPMASVEMAALGSTTESGDNSSRGGERSSTKSRMRLKIPLTTPGTTIKTLTRSLWEDLQRQGGVRMYSSSNEEEAHFAVTKKNVLVAEKILRTAFVEFYRGLTMLKSYSALNMVAVAKIVKKFDKVFSKFDKVAGYRNLPIYIKTVELSYFNTSDKAIILLEEVEELFARVFVKDDRSRARLHLRPPQKKSSHIVTFLLGLFTGGSLAFLAVFFVVLERLLHTFIAPSHKNDSLAPSPALNYPESIYLKTVFPLFGLSALIIIHLFMYGFNIYFWRKWRINYAFMFDLKQGTELRDREVLMIASVLLTVLLAAMAGHLGLLSVYDSPYVDFIPLGVFMLLVVLFLCPLNVFYRPSRIFLMTSFIHLAFAPLYKVVLQDFFLGDQLTSQVPAFRNLQYLICYYAGNFFRTSDADGCLQNEIYKKFIYVVSLLPYWWRSVQCIRRYLEEHDGLQLGNAGKYISAMVAVGLRIQHARRPDSLFFTVLFVLASIFTTVVQTYWDLWIDWGLMRKNSTNKWLRDNLIMPKAKYWYFLSMVANVILRLAWLQSITRWRFGLRDFQVADFAFAVLEVIRRGIWNFHRLENEQCRKVQGYQDCTLAIRGPSD